MTTLICNQTPYLRIYNPVSGEYVQFLGGRLDIEPEDPNYAVVMAEGASNPAITILLTAKGGMNCPECGALFTGQAGAAQLGKHRKDIHFDAWLADKDAAHQSEINTILKDRAGVACDVCRPAQVFPNDDALGQHIRLVHATAEDDAASAVTARRPGEVKPASGG